MTGEQSCGDAGQSVGEIPVAGRWWAGSVIEPGSRFSEALPGNRGDSGVCFAQPRLECLLGWVASGEGGAEDVRNGRYAVIQRCFGGVE